MLLGPSGRRRSRLKTLAVVFFQVAAVLQGLWDIVDDGDERDYAARRKE